MDLIWDAGTDRVSIHWFTPKMPAMSETRAGQIQEPGTPPRFPMWTSRTQFLAPWTLLPTSALLQTWSQKPELDSLCLFSLLRLFFRLAFDTLCVLLQVRKYMTAVQINILLHKIYFYISGSWFMFNICVSCQCQQVEIPLWHLIWDLPNTLSHQQSTC